MRPHAPQPCLANDWVPFSQSARINFPPSPPTLRASLPFPVSCHTPSLPSRLLPPLISPPASACAPLVELGLVQFGLVFTTLHPGLRRCCQVVNLPDDTYALALRALDGTFSAKQQTNCAVDFNLWTSPFATSRAKHAQVFNTAKKWVGRGGALSRACTAVSRCVPPPAPVSPTDGATACLCSIIPCSIAAAARALSFRQRCPCWREL